MNSSRAIFSSNPAPSRPPRLGVIAVSSFIAIYFLAFTKDARYSYFTPDDCMNLYRSWANPAAGLVRGNFLFFLNSPVYRPMAGAWYRVIFDIAGFNPVPFHIANLVILAANIWLTYCVARRLTGSRETGVLAAFLISYHGHFASLDFDTAFVYDVICYFFYFSALVFYLRVRSEKRPLKIWELCVLSALYICSLNAKEMALTLPAFLAIYEWLCHRRSSASWRGVLVAGLLTLACVIGRAAAGGPLAYSDFQPIFSWDRFMTTSRGFVTELLFQNHTVPSILVLIIWLILFVIAWASKSPALKFAWLFIMLSVIPVAFIAPRGAAQYYIPLFGWVLYAATALVQGSIYLFDTHWMAMFKPSRPALLFLGAAVCMLKLNALTSWADDSAVAHDGEQYRSIVEQVHRLAPEPRQGSRMLFMNDPIDDRWQLTSLMRLSYRDSDLAIDQVRFMPSPPSLAQVAAYDYVFSYRDCRFYRSLEPPPEMPEPGIVFDQWCRPSVFHSDGRAVTRQRPAKRGEAVMSMMKDLGDTQPASSGQPFPRNPLAQVTSPIEVRVDGRPAEIWVKIGWPGMVNRYRVDFRIPKSVRPGMPHVDVTSSNVSGLGMPIAVR